MLSHNAVREENRKLMLDEKMHSQVKELIENQLKEKKDGSSASVIIIIFFPSILKQKKNSMHFLLPGRN